MGNIIIGIGGTGGKVVKALRSRIQQTRDEDTNHYLCLDTMGYGYFLQEIYGDKAHTQRLGTGENMSATMTTKDLNDVIQTLAGNSQVAVSENEYLQLKGLEPRILGDILDNAYAHNDTYDWLRASDFKGVFGVSDKVFRFTEGAGQYRQIGRIASFATAGEILKRLSYLEQHSKPADGESRAVHILCSLAGGTGSGNFFDIAVLARHIFANATSRARQGGDDGNSDTINLLLLMNGVFDASDMSGGTSNDDLDMIAYSALRELGRLQDSPLPKSEWVFRYPEIAPISFVNDRIFDQVSLVDFPSDGRAGEAFRQDTVYPGMAEMVDLLTARGTSGPVNGKLINQNKQIRLAQGHPGSNKVDRDVAEAWKGSRFSPFFSTFSSFRILFPKVAYQKKARARAVEHFVKDLMGVPKEFDSLMIQKAFSAATNWSSLKPLFESLFGIAISRDFEYSAEHDGDLTQDMTPATRYLDLLENKAQVAAFRGHNLIELTRFFGEGLVEYNRDHVANDRWKLPQANRDSKLRDDLIGEVDNLRLAEFNIRSLSDMGITPPELTHTGGVQKAIDHALSKRRKQLETDIDNALKSLLESEKFVIEVRHHLDIVNSVYLDALVVHLKYRLANVQQECFHAQSDAKQSLDRLNENEEKRSFFKAITGAGGYKEKAEDYLQQENRLLTAYFKKLLNEAQLMLVEYAQQRIGQWSSEIGGLSSQLISENSRNSVQRLCTGVINSINAQLNEWAKSDNVSLGLPDHLPNKSDTSMGGFENVLCDEIIKTALNKQQVSWQLDLSKSEPSLGMFYGEEGNQENIDFKSGGAFTQLDELSSAAIKQRFEGWDMFKYICEYVCESEDKKLEMAAQGLFNKMSQMLAGINVPEGDTRIIKDYFVACADPTTGSTTKTAGTLWRYFQAKADSSRFGYNNEFNTEAENEFTIIRLDSGLTADGVDKLKNVRDTYESYIHRNSPILPLTHIFAEEQNMAVRECEMFQNPEVGGARLLPNALCQIYANQPLVELFLGLYYSGFIYIVKPEDGIESLTNHYWCFADFNRLQSLLKGSVNDLLKFTKEELRTNPQNYYANLFNLNSEVNDAQPGVSARKSVDKPDFFTAMARFVQRMPNGDKKHTRLTKFPFEQHQVQELNRLFKGFWAKRNETGEQMIERIVHGLRGWKAHAEALNKISDNEWAGKIIDSTTVNDLEQAMQMTVSSSPLTKLEAVEFVHQIGLFLVPYYRKVRPGPDI